MRGFATSDDPIAPLREARRLIGFGVGAINPFNGVLDALIDLLTPNAAALGSLAELRSATTILDHGTGATRLVETVNTAHDAGAARDTALKQVVQCSVDQFSHGH